MSILRLIAGGSPAAARMAADALRAEQSGSPMAAARAARAARAALEDPQATFSADERRAIAALLEQPGRTVDLHVPMTKDERDQVRAMADAAGLGMAEFVRQKIGL